MLKNEPPTLEAYSLGEKIAPKLSAIAPEDVKDIIQNLVPLYILRARTDLSVSDFAEDVLQAMDETGVDELQISGQEREEFKDRMVQLLSVESIDIGIKANDLLVEHEHTVHSTRVLTDLRPIFSQNPEDGPKAAVIVHMLKISYHNESDEVEEFYVGLDTGDINRLIDTLRRAESKADNLRLFLENTNVNYIHAE